MECLFRLGDNMKLIIDNIKLMGHPINNAQNVKVLINDALPELNFDLRVNDKTLMFAEYNATHKGVSNLFSSKKFNKIMLKENDARRNKLNRDFLNSRMLTKKQEASILKNIKNMFSDVGITASILLQEFNDDVNSKIELNNVWPVEQQSYPIEGE